MTEPTAFTELGALASDRDVLQDAVRHLRLPATVRERCANITAAVAAGQSAHFTLDRTRLPEVARRVVRITGERFPGPVIPIHSLWRQFEAGGVDRKAQLDARLAGLNRVELARTRIDLAVVSVLLGADAGPDWHYREADTGRRFVRAEGLAVASLHAFLDGRFSTDRRVPLRVDAPALARIDSAQLAEIFQVGADNPLVGLEGRVQLLRRLGAALSQRPDVFGEPARPGRLFDLLGQALVGGEGSTVKKVPVKRVRAPHILRALLKAFGGIWPGGQQLAGKPVGDTWAHPQAGGQGASAGRVPFHMRSQWLAYSLVEPFEWAGITVEGLDDLTGLPDARHGGLFIDAGVIVPRHAGFGGQIFTLADPWVIEWRAMTVRLLDELARLVRVELGDAQLPLARIMAGGTWAAGAEIAAERRPGGPPPVRVAINGTLF